MALSIGCLKQSIGKALHFRCGERFALDVGTNALSRRRGRVDWDGWPNVLICRELHVVLGKRDERLHRNLLKSQAPKGLLKALRILKRLLCWVVLCRFPGRLLAALIIPLITAVAKKALPGFCLEDRDAMWPNQHAINISSSAPGRRRKIVLKQYPGIIK